MTPRHGDVISDSHVTIHAPTHLYFLESIRLVHILRVDYIEYLLLLVLETLEHDEIFRWFFELNYVYDSIVVGNFEGVVDLAKFTVELLELYDHLFPMRLIGSLLIEPISQAVKVNQLHAS